MEASSDCTSGALASVSFVATTNEKALQACKVRNEPEPASSVIEGSKAFKQAFSAPVRIQGSASGSEASACPAAWGLVSVIVEAYNQHHELILRPDDVWQAILTQFSYYVNANAEALRDRFVDFQGKKTLTVIMGGTLFTADYAVFVQRMINENLMQSIKDPSVAEWLLPSFSTTAEVDRVAAAVSMMSTMQAYFSYRCCLMCGIPKVTLLGSPSDWRQLRAKADRLLDYNLKGEQMTAWHRMLAPVLDELVRSSESAPDLAFWDRVCSNHGGGSGPRWLSGWVTVFAVFSEKGMWQGDCRSLSVSRPRQRSGGEEKSEQESPWPFIDTNDLPGGVVAVPVVVDDNGTEYDTTLLAGQFAFEVKTGGVAVQSRTDWCLVYKGEPQAKVDG